MIRILTAMLVLAGCSAPGGPPDHPLVGKWQGQRPLTLKTTEYQFGAETGYWTAGRNDIRYKTESGKQERCDYSLSGRVLVVGGCRLAGQYRRVQ
jgi:hypothetical protein